MSNGEEPLDWIARSGKRAKGKRPEFFDEPALDRLYSLVLALAAEVSALRDRNDTLERLLEKGGALNRADIEAFMPTRQEAEERGLSTRAYMARIMRGFQQEVEAMEADDPPVMDWVKKLSEE